MRFQPVKCNITQITRKRIKKINASYSLEGTVLDNVEKIKYLGVTIINNLKWNTHVSNNCTKANKILGFLRRNLAACQRDVKELLQGTGTFKFWSTVVVVLLFYVHGKHLRSCRSLGAETRTQKNSPHKCLIQVLII